VYTFGRSEVALVVVEAPSQLIGKNVAQVSVPGEIVVVSITRNDQAFLPVLGTEFREGDLVHLSVLSSAMDRLEEMLGLERR
jgi:trk system potassium uptake protein TrkA